MDAKHTKRIAKSAQKAIDEYSAKTIYKREDLAALLKSKDDAVQKEEWRMGNLTDRRNPLPQYAWSEAVKRNIQPIESARPPTFEKCEL